MEKDLKLSTSPGEYQGSAEDAIVGNKLEPGQANASKSAVITDVHETVEKNGGGPRIRRNAEIQQAALENLRMRQNLSHRAGLQGLYGRQERLRS